MLFITSRFTSKVVPFTTATVGTLTGSSEFRMRYLYIGSNVCSCEGVVLRRTGPIFLRCPGDGVVGLFCGL